MMMKSPITITADKPERRFRRWAFLPLGVLALAALAFAMALFGAGSNPASAQQASTTFDTFATGNNDQNWIWSDGTTMYVSDSGADKVFAYNMGDKQHNSGQDFGLDAASTDNTGVWGNDATLYVADSGDDKIYAYNRSDMSHDGGKDIPLHADNGAARGLWSNGTTMWVADVTDDKIYAYTISSKARDSSKDIDMTGDGVAGPMDLWSDGTIMWVTSDTSDEVRAYNMPGAAPLATDQFAFSPGVGNSVGGIWSDGTYIWFADSGTEISPYFLNLPRPTSFEATPSGTSSRVTLRWDRSYRGDGYLIQWGLGAGALINDADRATIEGLSTTSYSLDLRSFTEYRFWVKTISQGDGETGESLTQSGSVILTTGGCKADVTIGGSGSYSASGAWTSSCGVPSGTHEGSYSRFYTFDLAERREVRVGVNAGDAAVALYLREGDPRSDGYSGDYLAAPTSTADADAYKVLDPGTYTVEVTNLNPGETGRFTLNINTRTLSDPPALPITTVSVTVPFSVLPDSFNDLETLSAAGNNHLSGIWSDGTTMWVADSNDDKIYAYELADADGNGTRNERVSDSDLETLSAAGNNHPSGIWSDGTTMWVADSTDDKIYAYELANADGDMDSHERVSSKDFTTLNDAGNNHPGGIWSDNTTMWVADSGDVKIYAYQLSDGARDPGKDFDTLSAAGNGVPTDIWSDGTTMWVADFGDDKIYAYRMSDKQRDSAKDFDTLNARGNNNTSGMWSNGQTMWVADSADVKIYAYTYLPETQRNTIAVGPTSCETVSLTEAGTQQGIWGPGPNVGSSCNSSVTAGYARYYEFHLTRESRVTITLTSNYATPRVFLREKRHPYWQIKANVGNEDRNLYPHYIGAYSNGGSRISETLPAGSYTIQAASNEAGQTGGLTLQVTGSGITSIPAPPASVLCAATPNQTLSAGTETAGQWGPGCESGTAYVGHFARFYNFTVPERKSVTVTLKDKDTPGGDYGVVLRRGTVVSKSGGDNDITFGAILGSAFNEGSQAALTMDLQAGTYHLEALGGWPSEFTIGYTLANPSAASNCFGRRIGENEEVNGRWFSDCPSTDQYASSKYAAYYDLRVSGSASKRVNIRLFSSNAPSELVLWRASDFTGSGSNRTLKSGASAMASHIVSEKTARRWLHVDLQGGDYVIETRATYPPSRAGEFRLGVTTGVEPADDAYVRENCGEVRYDVRDDGMPLSVSVPYAIESSRTVIGANIAVDEPGKFRSDKLIRLGQNFDKDNLDRCTGDRRDGFPVWHFVFDLDGADTDLTVGVGRDSGISNDRRHRWSWSQYNLSSLNTPTYTLRQLGGEIPLSKAREMGWDTDQIVQSDTSEEPMVKFFYGDPDEAPVVDCPTAGETPPCLTAGEYQGLTAGTYALTVTMDPPPSDPSRVTQDGPFSVMFTTTAGFGFGPEGPDTGNPPPDRDTFNPPVFSGEAEDQTARLYTAFSYTVPEATDPKGGAVTYTAEQFDGSSLNALPEWLSFDADTRTFSGTPEIDDYPATLNIVVTAGDDSYYQQTDSTAFTITVARPAENLPPMFHDGEEITFELAENSPAGTEVGAPLTAFDANGDALAYLGMDGADGAAFALGDDGQLTTIDGVEYDYENKDSYEFMALVQETDTEFGYMTGISVTVNLTNVNEAPAFAADLETTLSVAEDSPAGTNVGSAITATDPEGDTLTYSLLGFSGSETDAAAFAIDGSTGQITTKSGVTYDRDAKSSYMFFVTATEQDTDEGHANAVVITVNLTEAAGDANGQATGDGGNGETPPQQSNTVLDQPTNRAPTFDDGIATALTLVEKSPAGTKVGSPITATDPDEGDTVSYSLGGGADALSFDIGVSTGQITTVSGATYDYATKSSYSFAVIADDDKGGAVSTPVTVNLAKAATACKTDLGTLAAAALYAGKWNDATCKAHHQDGRARYFQFKLTAQTTVSVSLSAGALYVSAKGDPNNGWGKTPKGTYEHRKSVRRTNGKLVHDGPHIATVQNDGNSVELTLAAGTYTVEAAGPSSGGDFTVSVAPK